MTSHNVSVIRPQKKTIKSRIVGKKNQNTSEVKRDTPPPPDSRPLKRIKPLPGKSPPKSGPVTPPEVVEKVFRISGAKKYLIPEGPVELVASENKYAEGGFCVKVETEGKLVGLISAGGELECRKLLVSLYEGRY